MTTNTNNWGKENNKRFVAFLDIMGFKDRLTREGHDGTRKTLESLHLTLKDLKTKAQERINKKVVNRFLDFGSTPISIIFPVSFSDSIILISNDGSFETAKNLIFNVGSIMYEAIEHKIPMKGAIAYGEMTADIKEEWPLYFGQPLIDAYELHKELKVYGVVLHHTCEEHLSQLGYFTTRQSIGVFKYSVPMECGEINHYVVNWVKIGELFGGTEILVNKLYNTVSGKPRIYVDNTIKFVRQIRENDVQLLNQRSLKA